MKKYFLNHVAGDSGANQGGFFGPMSAAEALRKIADHADDSWEIRYGSPNSASTEVTDWSDLYLARIDSTATSSNAVVALASTPEDAIKRARKDTAGAFGLAVSVRRGRRNRGWSEREESVGHKAATEAELTLRPQAT